MDNLDHYSTLEYNSVIIARLGIMQHDTITTIMVCKKM
jgi:hypothetical protein